MVGSRLEIAQQILARLGAVDASIDLRVISNLVAALANR